MLGVISNNNNNNKNKRKKTIETIRKKIEADANEEKTRVIS